MLVGGRGGSDLWAMGLKYYVQKAQDSVIQNPIGYRLFFLGYRAF